MRQKQTYILTVVLVILTLALNACGSSASNSSIIATSVAMTVQAQNAQTAESTPTPTSLPPSIGTSTVPASPTAGAATRVPPTAPPVGSGNTKPCYSANFVADATIPDGTIVTPGASFIKSWSVLNSGSCTWNTTYKFVFMSGDIMGGGYVYPFPTTAAPGQTVDIPIQLYAPLTGGTYTGKWKIQAPDGTIFGVGQYDASLSVQIVVGSGTPGKGTTTAFGITAITYDVTRDPVAGCATNVYYTITAHITSNGPVKITYYWNHSDNYRTSNQTLTFPDASTKSISETWSVRLGNVTGTRWDQIIVTDPTYQEFGKATFEFLCGQ